MGGASILRPYFFLPTTHASLVVIVYILVCTHKYQDFFDRGINLTYEHNITETFPKKLEQYKLHLFIPNESFKVKHCLDWKFQVSSIWIYEKVKVGYNLRISLLVCVLGVGLVIFIKKYFICEKNFDAAITQAKLFIPNESLFLNKSNRSSSQS